MGQEYEQGSVTTYGETAEVIAKLGILPLAALIPGHLSLNGLTKPENWHTGTDLDPGHGVRSFQVRALQDTESLLRKRLFWSQGSGSRHL